MNDRFDATVWQRAGALFDELVELDAPARHARLAALDLEPMVRGAVDALLAGDAVADDRLPMPGFGLAPPVDVSTAHDPLGIAGETVSHFLVRQFVAAGGMGVVYRADDLQLRRPVALKFLTPRDGAEHGAEHGAGERLLAEARAAAALDHPNLCPVHEVGDSRVGAFLAMPWYAGETLRDRLARDGPLPLADVCRIAEQVTAGLHHVHAAGLVHGDVKPANVMLLADGTVKLLDFGIASLSAKSNVRGEIWGTLPYMAPEQLHGRDVDARADLWAVGVLLYEMLTGARPVERNISAGEGASATDAPIPRPRTLRVDLDEEAEALVLALLHPVPDARIGRADTVLHALESWRRRTVQIADPPSALRRVRRPLTVALLTLVAWAAEPAAARDTTAPERARLVMADFTLSGLDTALSRPLADEMRRLLGESRDATVLTRVQVDSALRRMRYTSVPPLSPALAREVARREGAQAVLQGTVAPLGNGVIATLQLVAVSTGEEWASFSGTATHPETQLLPTLRLLVDSVQQRLRGRGAIDRTIDAPRKLTTHSLQALLLVDALRRRTPAQPGEQMAILREALAHDSTMAYAWLILGNMLSGPYRTALRDSAFRTMYRLRDGLTPFEVAQITGIYHSAVEIDRPRALSAYERLLAADSSEFRVVLNAAQLLNGMREFQRAEAHLHRYRHALRTLREPPTPLVIALLGQGRVRAADSVTRAIRAGTTRVDSARGAELQFRMAIATRQYHAAMRHFEMATRLTDRERQRAMLARVLGRLHEARRLDALAEERRLDFWRVNQVAADPVYTRPLQVVRESLWLRGNPRQARAILDTLFATYPIGRRSELQHALDAAEGAALYAAAGNPARARAMLDTLRLQGDRITQHALQPLRAQALGEIALAEGRYGEAMQHFRRGALEADGFPTHVCSVCALPALARTAERAGWPDSARVFWTRYATGVAVDRHESDQWFLHMAYRRLEALHAAAGNPVESAKYGTLATDLWRNADSVLRPPILAAGR